MATAATAYYGSCRVVDARRIDDEDNGDDNDDVTAEDERDVIVTDGDQK